MTEETRVLAPLEERRKRYKAMTADRKAGLSLAAIAEKYGGMSRERVRVILTKPPAEAGWPKDQQIANARRRLLAQRAKWAKRASEASARHVAAIDAQLAELS